MNAMKSWASFPNWWMDLLNSMTAGKTAGRWMSALRVYLALSLISDFKTRHAQASITELESATGLSRPMVLKGIHAAEELGLLRVNRVSKQHSYTLIEHEGSRFAKVPMERVGNVLRDLPTRGYVALDCLKIYLLLLSVRPNATLDVPISHRRIVERTGIQPRRIRAGVDVLINHNLVHMDQAESAELGHLHNRYRILGLQLKEADAA